MAALAGAAVGGTVGGLTGALVGMGIPEYEAKRYEETILSDQRNEIGAQLRGQGGADRAEADLVAVQQADLVAGQVGQAEVEAAARIILSGSSLKELSGVDASASEEKSCSLTTTDP